MTFPTSEHAFGFGVLEIIFIVFIFGIYGVPLGIMIRYLRGQKVKSAMGGSAEPVAVVDSQGGGTASAD